MNHLMSHITMLHASLLRKPLWIHEGRGVTVSITMEKKCLYMLSVFLGTMRFCAEIDFCVLASVVLSFPSGL